MIPQESTFWADPDGADCDSDDDDLMPAGYRSRASFLISNQRGVSTLFNHGTDHQKKHRTGYFIDDPLYARGAYSSRTVPNPRGVLPNNTFVIERDGRWTERGAVEPLRSGDNWFNREFAQHFNAVCTDRACSSTARWTGSALGLLRLMTFRS